VTINQYPRFAEQDDTFHALWPHEARIRSMTYQTEILVGVELYKITKDRNKHGKEVEEI
jgi:DNA-directed RNA polymerase beta subunit